jgi:hypothetical protein
MMMLGNKSVSEIEEDLRVKFPEPFRTEFTERRQEEAEDIAEGKWHCFYFPFLIACGDEETTQWVVDNLTPLGDQMTGSIRVATADSSRAE